MPDEPRSWPPLLTGARCCRAAAPHAATIIAASPNFAAAAPKMSQKAVNYQDHPEGNKRCDNCLQFQPPDACKMVEGSISPQVSCRIFQAAKR